MDKKSIEEIKNIERQIKVLKEQKEAIDEKWSKKYNVPTYNLGGKLFSEFMEELKPIMSLIYELEAKIVTIKRMGIEVGEGITIYCWTDCHAYTVIEKSKSGKTIKIQRDKATRIDHNGMSEDQEYSYDFDPEGEIMTLRWSDKYHCYKNGVYKSFNGRREYYDYSF